MKRTILTIVVSALVVVGLMAGYNVYNASAAEEEAVFYGLNSQGGPGNSGGPGNRGTMQYNRNDISNIPASDLSADEEAALIYMVQEEQLARDVYTALNTQWGGNVFQNIMKSEQMHIDAVKQLLNRYQIADPSLEAGKYADPALQALYNDLISQGNTSLVEALKVGALIEETDISDLQDRLTKTDNADMQLVFSNLLRASSNHLRAFATNYANISGTVYEPSILSAEEFQTILNSPMGRGNGNGQAGNGTCIDGSNNNSRQPGANNFGGRMGGRR